MNENINLTQILKDCPKGTKLYSPLFGYVELKEIDTSKVYSVNVKLASGLIESFTREGKLYDRDYYKDTECVLFPSKEQRDWSKFTAPWYKKESDTIASLEKQGKKPDDKTKTLEKLIKPKFDPNTLQPFDKVIARNFNDQIWHADIFSHVETDEDGSYYNVIKNDNYLMVIPYNDDTIYLVGTSLEAPEYYRYWED